MIELNESIELSALLLFVQPRWGMEPHPQAPAGAEVAGKAAAAGLATQGLPS